MPGSRRHRVQPTVQRCFPNNHVRPSLSDDGHPDMVADPREGPEKGAVGRRRPTALLRRAGTADPEHLTRVAVDRRRDNRSCVHIQTNTRTRGKHGGLLTHVVNAKQGTCSVTHETVASKAPSRKRRAPTCRLETLVQDQPQHSQVHWVVPNPLRALLVPKRPATSGWSRPHSVSDTRTIILSATTDSPSRVGSQVDSSASIPVTRFILEYRVGQRPVWGAQVSTASARRRRRQVSLLGFT